MKRTLVVALGAWLFGCGGGETPAPCDGTAADGIAVAAMDPYGGSPYALGYPPYAVDGCRLAYVSESGDLRLRDLADGGETVLATADRKPRRPAIAGDLVAWEAEIEGRVQVQARAGGRDATTIAGAFDHAWEPRVAADAVVLTGWLGAEEGSDTDVFLFQPSTGKVSTVASGPGQQRFPDVSATHVAWTDFAEDPDGVFGDDGGDAADIAVRARAGGDVTIRKLAGKQAFPMLGAEGKIAYLDWGLVHPEPKFSEYEVRLGPIAGGPMEDAVAAHILTHTLYVRPVARGERISWVTADGAGATLLQRGVDLGSPEETVNHFEIGPVFGPSASDAWILVGASETNGGVTLRAFTH